MSEETVLVTGGSRGIGRRIVEVLVEQGRQVAFTWRSAGAAACELEESTDGRARAFELDLDDRARPSALVAEIEERSGPIIALVNNAGIERSQLLALTSDALWDEIIDVNLGGTFRCVRAVLPRMVRRRQGAIVNIVSLSALHGLAGHGAYAASKAGLVALTRCVAREVGKRGIRVNAVAAGLVATEMTRDLPDEVVESLRARESLNSGVTSTDVARTVAFLLSESAQAITGQVLVVDAGTSG